MFYVLVLVLQSNNRVVYKFIAAGALASIRFTPENIQAQNKEIPSL